MDLTQASSALTESFFDEQPQPAFWMLPLWNDQSQVIDFEYRYCNREFYRYTGVRPEAIIGQRVSSSPIISDPAARAKLFQELLRTLETGERMQAWINNPDLRKYYSYTRNKVADGVLTVLQDRTEEHLMMQQLEEQKHLMDKILLHSSNAITVGEAIRDASGRIVDFRTVLVNDAAVRFTGISRDVYLARTGGELDPNFPGSDYFRLCVHCMETGEPAIAQYCLEPGGRWLEVTVSRMDEQRQIYIFTDITPIKQAQLEQARAARKLEEIVNRTQSGVFTATPLKDENGTITDFSFVTVNRAFARYRAADPPDLVGTPLSQWFAEYLHNGLFAIYRQTYLEQELRRFDFHYQSDGIDIWIDLLCTRFDDELLVTFTDYTPIKNLQLESASLVEALQRSNANLEEFAHAASHDLQEPLRKIHFFTERLRNEMNGRLDPAQESMFERITRASERMSLLVDDLLTYSRLSLTPPEKEAVSLDGKLRAILTDLELQIEETGAKVEWEPLPVVQGYRRQLQQLFHNLLANALKYRRPDIPVQIRIATRLVRGADFPQQVPADRADDSFHLIEVRDNGIGFEPHYAERIFQLFQRLHGREEYAGTGIGLSIARRVVSNHRGFLWAEGAPDAGARFFILLPA